MSHWNDCGDLPAGHSDAFGQVLQLVGQPALLDDAAVRDRHLAEAVVGRRIRDLELLQGQHHHLAGRRLLVNQQVLARLVGLEHFEHVFRVIGTQIFVADARQIRIAVAVLQRARNQRRCRRVAVEHRLVAAVIAAIKTKTSNAAQPNLIHPTHPRRKSAPKS